MQINLHFWQLNSITLILWGNSRPDSLGILSGKLGAIVYHDRANNSGMDPWPVVRTCCASIHRLE